MDKLKDLRAFARRNAKTISVVAVALVGVATRVWPAFPGNDVLQAVNWLLNG